MTRVARSVSLALLLSLLLIGLLAGCVADRTTTEDDFAAEDAVLCRELGADLVHIRYESDEGTYAVTRPGLDRDRAQGAQGISAQAREGLRALGWDDEALEELAAPTGELSPEVRELLESRPSCLEELRAQDD
jgi:hypothetical protein